MRFYYFVYQHTFLYIVIDFNDSNVNLNCKHKTTVGKQTLVLLAEFQPNNNLKKISGPPRERCVLVYVGGATRNYTEKVLHFVFSFCIMGCFFQNNQQRQHRPE